LVGTFNENLYFIIFHKWKYWIAILLSKFYSKTKHKVRNVVYVAREKDKEWIFGAKVRRLSKFSSLKASTYFHNKLKNLPKADGYYFIYQNYFCRCIRSTPSILKRKTVVMFTHPNWTKKYSKAHVIWCLKKADFVICLNSDVKRYLVKSGLQEHKLKVLHIATSSNFFQFHERGSGYVGFCSAYHPRKNPDLIYEIVKNMPNCSFLLLGQNWHKYEKFNQLIALANFKYYDSEPYENYPSFYEKMDVFVTPSILEGGPVPLLESMMSNCVPVASKTGFAPDIITHGINGFLFDIDADYKTVVPLIKQALTVKANIRKTVLKFTWENCSKEIDNMFLSE
jgi:glycosyltransferase involved in cell wall biosynthesis